MTNFTKAILRLSKKDNHADVYDLHFDLIQTSFLQKWINRYLHAKQRQDQISEPWAFYNLNDDWNEQSTVDFLNYHINECNKLSPGMFERKLVDINDQDTLNQIHSVFELNHGKLDEWKSNALLLANPTLREHLSHVNQAVHRCEGVVCNKGRIRVVYFDLPKDYQFDNDDYQLFSTKSEFGGLYTLYADVGKNLESLTADHDDHHHDFVPNLHYSIDCVVKFYNDNGIDKTINCNNFLNSNLEYFKNKGYSKDDPRLTVGDIKLAQLIYTDKQDILNRLRNYNYIQDLILY